MAKPVLYSYYRSSCSWRVRIALAWKGIDYEYKAVNLIKDGGEQTKDEYKSISPMGQIPSLIIDGKTLTQSVAILEYLEEAYPAKNLLPQDPYQRFKVREIVEIIGSGIQPLQNISVLQQFEEPKKTEWARKWISKGLTALEKVLQGCSNKYCVGDEVTFADCCLVPQLYNARRFGIDLSELPLISAIDKNLEVLEPFIHAHAHRQPDCPPELAAKSQ